MFMQMQVETGNILYGIKLNKLTYIRGFSNNLYYLLFYINK